MRVTVAELDDLKRAAIADGYTRTANGYPGVSAWGRDILLDLIKTAKAGAADAIRKAGHRPP